MEHGQKGIEIFGHDLRTTDLVSCRMALRKKENHWFLQNLIVDAIPTPAPAEWSVYDYGDVIFINERLRGEQIADWLIMHSGQAAGCQFALPQIQPSVTWSHETSHVKNTGYSRSIYRLPFPHTLYRLNFSSSEIDRQVGFTPLIKENCPVFPDYYDAVYRLLFGLARQLGEDRQSGDIIVRIAHTEAWIDHITFYPRQISVTIKGSKVAGARLVIGGTDKSFDEKLLEPGTLNYELPEGLPDRLWMILACGDDWVDRRDLELGRGASHLGWDNISFEPGSVCEQMKEWIYQGESNIVEFKQQLPPDEDKFLKTVAAFANGAGGVFLLGVVNGTGEIKGITEDIGAYKDGITDKIRRKLIPHPDIHIEHCEIDGRLVVAVIVEEGEFPPYGLTQGMDKQPLFYVRRNATTFVATQSEIRVVARKRTPEEQARITADYSPLNTYSR